MAYPPTIPPNTRANTTPQFDNHPGDHNDISDALTDIVTELGSNPGGDAADLTARLATLVPVGSITMYGSNVVPAGWLLCDGTAVNRVTYAALFTIIGTTFGAGDGSTTFNVPDLRGRFPVGRNGADAAFDTLNESGGSKDAVVVSHKHSVDLNHDHPNVVSGGQSVTHTHGFVQGGSVWVQGDTITPANLLGITPQAIPTGGFKFVTATENASVDHSHNVNLPALGPTPVDSATVGVSATNANLPPYRVLTFIIRAAA